MSKSRYTSSLSNVTSPVMRQFFTKSFIRLRLFSKVDFPHPDGPMKAVISLLAISKLMFFKALKSP